MIYGPVKCLYTNYIVHIRYIRHQIDKLYGALLPFLLDGSVVAIILVSLITESVLIRLQRLYNRWIRIANANQMVYFCKEQVKYERLGSMKERLF